MESRKHIKESSVRDTQSAATIQTAPGIVSSLIMWHNIHPSPGGFQGRKEYRWQGHRGMDSGHGPMRP